ncbi:hypothetical protein N9165_00295 [Akkermansiaceae bacterium]|jgi:hypothetical protein|nr:hypothetical protein [Akkermansiaceae bacterium]
MKKLDRFDLETQIMDCWNVVSDIDLVFHAEIDDEDEMANALLGLRSINELKFRKLWITFEKLVEQGDIK